MLLRNALELCSVPAPPLAMPGGAAFAAHARALTLRNLKLAALLLFTMSLASWLIDALVYRRAPEIAGRLEWMRAIHTASMGGVYLGLRFTRLARWVIAATMAVVGLSCIVLGWTAGTLGDLTTPWFHFTYVGAIGVLVPVVPLRIRALYGLVFAAGLALGFAIARPIWPGPPMLVPTVTFLLITTTAAVAIGHVVYQLIERGLESARARDRAALALEELNHTLEERVGEQTQELRLLMANLESAREDERARIARDLHDELGQELTAMRYTLTFLRRRFERDPGSIRPNLDELESLLGRAATTTRQILADLRPRILDDLGLDAGVEWLVKRTEERSGVRCRLVTSCRKLDLDVETSITAFRVLQESLTNVVRHAQATHVDVAVVVEDGQLCMSVRDDGVGMETTAPKVRPPGKGGMGLLGMRERVGALGGALRLESRPGRGTTVRAHLPLTAARAALNPMEAS